MPQRRHHQHSGAGTDVAPATAAAAEVPANEDNLPDDAGDDAGDDVAEYVPTQGGAASIAEAPPEGWVAPRAVAYVAPDALSVPALSVPALGTTDDADLPYWLALNRVRGIGPARFKLLLDAFGSAEAAWRGTPSGWQAAGLDMRTTASFEQQRRRIVPEAELERLHTLRVSALRVIDASYPRLLREIPLPPPLLYVRGTLLAEDAWAVAVVGTRRVTVYGRAITEQLSRELAQQHITVVSGLARGVDTIAHTATLDAGGRTVAVLGCGPDLVYPPENAKLAARIIEQGALVTEFAPGTQPEAGNFPARNRLISGLSLAVLVTEAPADSGALITARFAGEQGRDVFAVPGNINSRASTGANRLIQDGAKLVLSIGDVLSELNLHLVPPPDEGDDLFQSAPAAPLALALGAPEPENETEAQVLGGLSRDGQPRHIDELCRALGLPVATVSGTLVLLELRGMVRLTGPMTYARES